ncbi:MAG: hypothetical protein ACRBB0_17880 [Pelagimonas sp.]|uniref:hypothetical protein n=1 Tax=Pelagimonas sp. TaxID=2073170 RepID=UPI003D6BA78C
MPDAFAAAKGGEPVPKLRGKFFFGEARLGMLKLADLYRSIYVHLEKPLHSAHI